MQTPREYVIRPGSLADKIILVTGAGDGIGKIAAQTFAACGATVILSGRTLGKLEQVYDEIVTWLIQRNGFNEFRLT